MKYLAIAVLLAIVAGAIIYYANHRDDPPPAASGMDATLIPEAANHHAVVRHRTPVVTAGPGGP